jgi:urease accessory protein
LPVTVELLLLVDGRTPTGGHAHSGGLEAAVASGLVGDAISLHGWLIGRLETVGRVDAAFSAAWWARCTAGEAAGAEWAGLVDEYWARTPAAALRDASRAQARGVLRAGRAMWPGPAVAAASAVPGGAPWPLAFAAVAADAGVGLEELTLGAASTAVTGPAWAATRLLGLDPYEVARCLVELAARVQAVASASRRWGRTGLDPSDLPAGSGLLLDIGAERHATWEVRLFAS